MSDKKEPTIRKPHRRILRSILMAVLVLLIITIVGIAFWWQPYSASSAARVA